MGGTDTGPVQSMKCLVERCIKALRALGAVESNLKVPEAVPATKWTNSTFAA